MRSCLIRGVLALLAIFVLAWITGYMDILFKVSIWVVSALLILGVFMNTKNGDGPPGGRPGDQY